MPSEATYIGRFAPSPSGPLHFGSLVAALASFLDARAQGGRWLLRMEDLDPAREPPQAAASILRSLEAFGLHWDGEVLYQSTRLEAYRDALKQLRALGLIYTCDCSRQDVQAMGGVYDGRCRARTEAVVHGALRVKVADETITFNDLIQGPQAQQLLHECGDFVVLRKDGLFAYQLAVVVDDAFQGISHVVRGVDLLDSTARQIYLQRCLGETTPQYAHIPVAVNADGQKLSKQHFARAIDDADPVPQLLQSLQFLGQAPAPELREASTEELLHWAIGHWDIQAVPKLANIRHDCDPAITSG
ncbi:MAG: tRNA glutamyl-Q(34) synthetase GluQRS [Gammaproteobacteria bacterium]|nr:tRNA glutamyl-Q(34) synthetase GluQRS [Pseudomonadales bacterium]MCP5330753.1 tRNA glutamyl-Q(34) synthetase GluQRS [Pseudomonadales bacterium]